MSDNDGTILDIILTGGWVIDGTGGPARIADVGIRGDRVAGIGDLSKMHAGVRHDIVGLAVAPGFVDTHTHYDLALFATPEMPFAISQGVTTVVVGNCGISAAPLDSSGVLPRPLDLLGDAAGFRFPSFAGYLSALDADPPAVNTVALAGHTTLRAGALPRLDRAATPAELDRMATALEEALAAGAAGLSSGLAYSTAQAAPAAEVAALAHRVAASPGGGLYAAHLRDESEHIIEAMEEALEIARAAGVPVIFSHHKTAGRANYGRTAETLAWLEAAGSHHALGIDAYPYAAGATELSADRVAWADRVLITFSRAMPEVAGRDLTDVAAALGVSIHDAIARLHPAGAIYFIMDEADVRRVLAWRGTMIGSDGIPAEAHPHPRLWGTFARVLGHYSRDLGLLPLEEAVCRMTSLPAERFRLAGRGVLRPGACADVVVFDPATIADRSTYENPEQPAAGVTLVLVNGRVIWRDGQPTGARPGRVLRRSQPDGEMR